MFSLSWCCCFFFLSQKSKNVINFPSIQFELVLLNVPAKRETWILSDTDFYIKICIYLEIWSKYEAASLSTVRSSATVSSCNYVGERKKKIAATTKVLWQKSSWKASQHRVPGIQRCFEGAVAIDSLRKYSFQNGRLAIIFCPSSKTIHSQLTIHRLNQQK